MNSKYLLPVSIAYQFCETNLGGAIFPCIKAHASVDFLNQGIVQKRTLGINHNSVFHLSFTVTVSINISRQH